LDKVAMYSEALRGLELIENVLSKVERISRGEAGYGGLTRGDHGVLIQAGDDIRKALVNGKLEAEESAKNETAAMAGACAAGERPAGGCAGVPVHGDAGLGAAVQHPRAAKGQVSGRSGVAAGRGRRARGNAR
jgi:hypothetical protein